MEQPRLMSRRVFVMGATIGAAGAALGLSSCGGSGSSSSSSASQVGAAFPGSSQQTRQITAAVSYKGTDFYPPHNRSALALAANWHVLQGLYDYDPRTHTAHASLASGDPIPVTTAGSSGTSTSSAGESSGATGTTTGVPQGDAASSQGAAASSAGEAASSTGEAAETSTETSSQNQSSGPEAMNVSATASGSVASDASATETSGSSSSSSSDSAALATADSVLEYQVKLRSQVSFSDGTPLTAQDVVNAFDLNMHDGDYAQLLAFIAEVKAVDDTTISLRVNYPCDVLKERLSLVKVFPASASKQDMQARPVGTGPWAYRSVQGIDGGNIEFIPNSQYSGEQKASCELMHWDVLIDGSSRVQKYTSGAVSVVDTIPEDSAATLEEAGATIWHEQGFACPMVVFNTKKAPFDDVRARQAFLYAIDTDALIAGPMGGYATAATSVLPENHASYHRASKVYDYEAETAKELLDQAGAQGAQITLRYNVNWVSDLINEIIEDEQAAGFNVSSERSANPLDDASDATADVQPFDVIITCTDPTMLGNDADLLLTWLYGDTTWTRLRSSWAESDSWTQLQGLLEQARRERNAEQRQNLWNQCQDLISEEVPLYPLFHRMLGTASNAEVMRGFKAGGTTGPYLLGASLA